MKQAHTTKALILAAGLGTRLRPLTDAIPKCLIDINGKPLLEYWLESLEAAGVPRALVNTHHLATQVRDFLAERNKIARCYVEEFYEPELLGSAGTVTAVRSWADDVDQILIIYADNFSDVNLSDLLTFHASHNDPISMLLFRAENPSACGIVELGQDHRVIGFQEKPPQPRSDLANGGVYVVDADAFRQFADRKGFDLAFDVLPAFIGCMRGWQFDGIHIDVGTHPALERVRSFAASGTSRHRTAVSMNEGLR